MAFVAVAATVGGAIGLGGTAAIIGGGALIGAGVGGAYSAITGDGNILNSMLTGGLIGGAGAYGIGAMGYGGAGVQAQMAGPFFGGAATGTGTVGPAATAVKTASPAMSAANTTPGFAYTPTGEMVSSAYPASVTGAQNIAGVVPSSAEGIGAIGKTATAGLTGGEKLALGLGATSLLSLMGSQNQPKLSSNTGTTPSYIRPYTYSSTQNQPGGPYPAPYATVQYDQAGNPVMDTRERDYFTQSFTAGEPYTAANGGLMAAGGPVERMSQMNTAINPQGGMYPQGMVDKTQYALPTQRPTSMEVIDAGAQRMYAKGGKTEDEDESYMDRMKRIKQMNSMLDEIKETGRVAPPDLGEYVPTMRDYKPSKLNLMAMPQSFVDAPQTKGVMGRIGGAYALDRDTQLLGGLSGFAGRDRGALTVRPETIDVGLARRMGPGFLSGQYERSLTGQQPPRYMANYNIPYAEGGEIQGYNLGGYSDGGRLLKGPGDGVSDNIPAVIGNRQPARLADGEFVIPARIVSELGNGSTDAGAKRLYAMMDKIQAGRKKTVGKGKVAVDSKAKKHLLA
jgi:hypothetical protein